MPAYRVDHPDFAKPRMVEAVAPRGARAHVAKEFSVKMISAREVHDLTTDGVDLEQAVRKTHV